MAVYKPSLSAAFCFLFLSVLTLYLIAPHIPELPEVETIRRNLKKGILNKGIKDVLITAKARINKRPRNFKHFLIKKKFSQIDRIGKLLIFHFFGTEDVMLSHLKMTGQFIYREGDKITVGGHSGKSDNFNLPNNQTRLIIIFLDGSKLYFNDLRRFGYLHIVKRTELVRIRSEFGIEPLTSGFTFANFKDKLNKRKSSVKAVLLNQKLFAGIGNIYADEACFAAGILPNRQAAGLSARETKSLYFVIQKIIKKAIDTRGTTFNNYTDGYGRKGSFVKFLKVYGRAGEKCGRCESVLQYGKVAGRGTVFCKKCQK